MWCKVRGYKLLKCNTFLEQATTTTTRQRVMDVSHGQTHRQHKC